MADPPRSLSNIPYDCHREIIRRLDLQAIKNLRLTSRQMKELCSGPCLNGFLKRQTIDMSKQSLDSLLELASYEEFRGVVRELRVRVPLYDAEGVRTMIKMKQPVTPEDLDFVESQEVAQKEFFQTSAVDILTSALKPLGRLKLIDLDLVVITGVGPRVCGNPRWWDWDTNSNMCSQICCLFVSAIAKSGISMEELSMFRCTLACSVPLYELAATMDDMHRNGHKMTGSDIKKFSIKIAAYSIKELELILRHLVDGTPPQDSVQSFVRFLGQMPNLEDLHLYMFNTPINNFGNRKIVRAIASHIHWPRLRRCILGGIYTEESSLVKFFTAHPRLESLVMKHFVMVSGTWDAVFKVLSEQMPSLTSLRLSNLLRHPTSTTQGREVNLLPRWEEQIQEVAAGYFERGHAIPGRDSLWVHTRDFDADDLKRGLEFWPMPAQYFSFRGALIVSAKYGILSLGLE